MERKQLFNLLLVLLLLFSFFPLNVFVPTVVAADPVQLRLMTQGSDYTNLSFTDLGIYYTPQALCEFHMPFSLQRSGNYETVNNTDLDGNFTGATGSFNERLLSYDYSILATNANFYIVDFRMNTTASLENFSVDFVPNIKNVNFSDYAWYNSNWSYKKQIIIDHNQVPSTLTNFPVLVYRATDNDLKAHVAQGNGEDIAFVDSTETTQFNHELEDYANGNGRLVAWVNVTSISSSVDTTFYMYYGNDACADQQDADNTWDSNYTGVFHMYELVGDCLDSTSNSNDGTYTGDLATRVSAKILYGQDFDGTNDNITIPKAAGVNGEGTIELWAEPDTEATQIIYVSYGDVDNYVFLGLYGGVEDARLKFNGKYGGSNLFTLEFIEDYVDSYYCMAGAWTNNDSVFFVDGVSRDTDTTCDTTNFTLTMGSVGTDSNGASDYDGELDELRISDIRRSNDWLETCYNNQNNQTTFCTFGSEQEFDLGAPTGFTASTENNGDITLDWTLGINTTYTYIERNTISSWARGDGTFIYNDTGVTVLDDDTSLACNIVYYYRAWGFNATSHDFSGSASANNITCPGNPSSSTAVVWDGNLNITWVKNSHADKTQLLRKTGSYPSSPVDGTVLYNGTLLYYNDSSVTTSSYYTLFSWNTTVSRHSTGLQRAWGQIEISVYDENTSAAITGWDVFISNEDGTQTFESLTNTNPEIIDIGEDLPYGDNTIIIINASWYTSQVFIMDIEVNNHYTLDAYLSESNATELYVFFVVNEGNDPIEEATMYFKRYINDSEGWQNVSIIETDANGQVNVHLIPNEKYIIEITKTNYETETIVYTPDPDYHGIYYSKTFILKFSREPPDIITPSDVIHFNGTINSSGVITVWYEDFYSHTTNTVIYIYEYYNGTLNLNYTDTRTGDNSFSFTDTGYNTTRIHKLVLHVNQTDLEGDYAVINYFISALVTTTAEGKLENYFIDVFGNFDLGWVKTFLIFIPCIFLLVVFGASHTGLGILSAGMYLGFTGLMLDISHIATYASLGSMLAVAGVVVILVKQGRRVI